MVEQHEILEESHLGQWTIWGSSSAYLVGPYIDALAKSYRYKYYGGGQNGEWGHHTIARIGARPFTIRVPSKKIPALAKESITVDVTNSLPRAKMRKFQGTLNGVHGMLASSKTGFSFTRTSSGEETSCRGQYIFEPDLDPIQNSDTIMLWLGKNDINAKSATINDKNIIVKLAVIASEWAYPKTSQVAVLGHFANTDMYRLETDLFSKIEFINAEYSRIFGKRYFNVPDYLYSSDVWLDTKLVPTDNDLINQHNRCLPLSLARDHGAHLNDKANAAITLFLERQMKDLKWI